MSKNPDKWAIVSVPPDKNIFRRPSSTGQGYDGFIVYLARGDFNTSFTFDNYIDAEAFIELIKKAK